MFQGDGARVQTDAVEGGSPIEGIPENRDATLRGMDTDLVCSTGERFGTEERAPVSTGAHGKPRFGRFSCLRIRDAGVTGSGSCLPRLDDPGLTRNGPVREQQVAFVDAVFGKLLGERTIGGLGLSEDQHAGGFLVEAMNNREACPDRFTMPEPIVDPFSRMR